MVQQMASTQRVISSLANLPSKDAQPSDDHGTNDVDKVPLTYDDLKLAFYILYIGLTISTICFLTEVLLSKLKS